MSYNDDAVKAKFSALAETQESIVTVAQWVMFHRRHAERTAVLWLQRLKESPPPKRLNLIYLANEVIQQSKARKKDDFLVAFSPIIAEATEVSYKGSTHEIQQKLRRVIEVWRQRQIFEGSVQTDLETRIDDHDKAQPRAPPTKKPMLGGSLFSDSSSSAAPAEIAPLVPLQQSLTKASISLRSSLTKADTDYGTLNNSGQAQPTPPVLAARLSALVKILASAEDAVAEAIKTRKALVAGLERLLETNRTELVAEERQQQDLAAKREATSRRRQAVEEQIMRGLATETTQPEVERPEVESFTPPPEEIESTTPPGLPPTVTNQVDGGIDMPPPKAESFTAPHVPDLNEYSSITPVDAVPSIAMAPPASLDPRKRPAVTAGVLNAHPRPDGSSPTTASGGHSPEQHIKRRRIQDEYAGFGDAKDGEVNAMDGLDADVVGMLG